MHIWLLDGSKKYFETGVRSYENAKLLEEAKKHTPDVEHICISDVTSHGQTLHVKGVPVDHYPDLVLPRNTDLNTTIRPLPILEILEDRGSVCMNSHEGVERAMNKIIMGYWLNQAGLPYPKTIDYVDNVDPEEIVARLGQPFFLKQAQGAEGSGIAYCRTIEEFHAAKKEFQERQPNNPLLAQEAVNSSLGVDVRAFVLDGQVIATMLRKSANPKKEVRANISLGGRAEVFDLPDDAKKLAIEATAALKLDYSGLDFLFLPNNKYTICEIGSNPDWSAMEEDFPIPNNIARSLIAHGMKLVEHSRR